MGNWQVGPVNSYIDIFPGWGMEQEKTWINISHQRRRDGSLKSYQEAGDFDRFSMPLSWVSSGDKALVNSWAQDITDLRLIPDSDFIFIVPSSITNGDFETGDTSGWTIDASSANFIVDSGSPYAGDYNGLVDITDPGSLAANIQVHQDGYSIIDTKKYKIRFAAMAVDSRTAIVNVHEDSSPFANYGLNETITLTNSWQIFELEFTANTTASDARINFRLGGDANNVSLDEIEFHPGSYYDVRITNTQEPFTSRVRPYDNFYQGEVVFETI